MRYPISNIGWGQYLPILLIWWLLLMILILKTVGLYQYRDLNHDIIICLLSGAHQYLSKLTRFVIWDVLKNNIVQATVQYPPN